MPLRRRGSQARRHPRRRVLLGENRHVPFEDLVETALDGLPEPFQRLLENVAVVIEDEPTPDELRDSGLAEDESLYGLYDGVALTTYGADAYPYPNKITLYRLPLEEDFPDPDELAREVQKTVVHELAHHAGFDEGRLGRLGY